MIDVLGNRQQQLLRLLLKHKTGLTIDQLTQELAITRTAVRQHLSVMENDGLITPGLSRPSGGRPEQLYILSAKGHELFPRHYSWMAELVIDSIRQESGAEQLSERLRAIGEKIGEGLRSQNPGLITSSQWTEKLAELMQQLGYNITHLDTSLDEPTITADNCIFHKLAAKDPTICEFDLALISSFTGSKVDHQECMVKGGNSCRFKLTP